MMKAVLPNNTAHVEWLLSGFRAAAPDAGNRAHFLRFDENSSSPTGVGVWQ